MRVRSLLELASSQADEHHLSAAIVLPAIPAVRITLGPTGRNWAVSGSL